jgi:hypothetical protein
MLFKKVFAVYSENNVKLRDSLCGQNTELLNVKEDCIYNYDWPLNN